jgi:spore coat protein CotF
MENNNMVQNQETEIPKNNMMNDRDFLNDILATKKAYAGTYQIALNEASNKTLYNTLFKIYKETQDMQRELFNLMFKKGWYPLEKAEQNKITQKYNQFSGYINQINQ